MPQLNSTNIPVVRAESTPTTATTTHISDHVSDLKSLIGFYKVLVAGGFITPSAPNSNIGTVLDLTKLAEVRTIKFEAIAAPKDTAPDSFLFDRAELAKVLGDINPQVLATAIGNAINLGVAAYLIANPIAVAPPPKGEYPVWTGKPIYVFNYGDSQTALGGVDSYPAQLGVALSSPNYTVLNLGHAGDRATVELVDRFQADVINQFKNAGVASYNIFTEFSSGNDFRSNPSITPRQVADAVKARFLAAKAAGFITLAITSPASASPDRDGNSIKSKTDDYNSIIRSEAVSIWGCYDIVDLAADTRMQTPGDTNYFDADLVHLSTPLGKRVVAYNIKNKIDIFANLAHLPVNSYTWTFPVQGGLTNTNVVWSYKEFVTTSEGGNSLAFNNGPNNFGYGRANSVSQFLSGDGMLTVNVSTSGLGIVGLYNVAGNFNGTFNTTDFYGLSHNSANNKLQSSYNGVYSEVFLAPSPTAKARIVSNGTAIKTQYTSDGTTWTDLAGSVANRQTGTLYPVFWSNDFNNTTHNVILSK